jgi:hypothetical protein
VQELEVTTSTLHATEQMLKSTREMLQEAQAGMPLLCACLVLNLTLTTRY